MSHFNRPPRSFLIALLALSFICSGCATTQDLTFINRKISDNASKIDKHDEEIRGLMNRQSSAIDAELLPLKKRLADTLMQLHNAHERIFTLESNVEDYRQFIERSNKDNAREIEGIKIRLDRLEELSKSISEGLEAIREFQSISQPAPKAKAWEDLDEEAFYNLAYQTFQKNEYDSAREIFVAFLDKYPKGKFSDNATFWIGECFYKTDQFEQAILEYEKVKQNYPSGDKVPSALFKQGLAFLKLNKLDETKIIFNQLIQHYPQSEQALMAKAQLEKLK